jgi:hypothetical protein
MNDDNTKRGPQDRGLISLEEDYEIHQWCEELGVTKVELQRLVHQVGHSANAVRRELAK